MIKNVYNITNIIKIIILIQLNIQNNKNFRI